MSPEIDHKYKSDGKSRNPMKHELPNNSYKANQCDFSFKPQAQ